MSDPTLLPPSFSRPVNDGLVRLTQLSEARNALLNGTLGDFGNLKDTLVASLDGEIASFSESVKFSGRYFHDKTRANRG